MTENRVLETVEALRARVSVELADAALALRSLANAAQTAADAALAASEVVADTPLPIEVLPNPPSETDTPEETPHGTQEG